MTLESFVIRIYRRPSRAGRGMVGVVQGERTAAQQAFTSAEELWDLLVRAARRAPRPGSGHAALATSTKWRQP